MNHCTRNVSNGFHLFSRTTRLVYSYYDRTAHHWKQGTWSKTVRNAVRRGAAESLMEDRLQRGADKWRAELFNHRPELWEGEQTAPVGSTKKWETVASGQWMQGQHGTEW
jgi:hypothetical protein